MVDDYNVTNEAITYCAREAEERGDHDAAMLARALLGLTYRQRLRLLRGVWPRA